MTCRTRFQMVRGRRAMLAAACACAIVVPVAGIAWVQASDDAEDPAIQYTKTAAQDPVAQLQKKIDSGQAKLEFDSRHGYLPAVLKLLHIPVSSQMLVFSKTSFQRDLISPKAPRALYFNDGSYVGWVQGGRVLEIATVDPQLGAVFYLLPQERDARPRFVRQSYECLQCHSGTMTAGVPGHVMRSVYARADGQPEFRAGTYLTTDQSPMKERWGGWYVTGKHGDQRHMGNVFARGSDDQVEIDYDAGANVTDLSPFLDTSPYLAKTSDIVALMVAEHQTRTENLITKANYQTRIALAYEAMLNKELHRPEGYRAESTLSRIASVGEPLVKALLFSGEAKLTAPVVGTSGFAEQFSAEGPRDKQGRSLRQLDLRTRLMRYPCSYLIYSDAFDGLPALAKEYVYRRLAEVLTGRDQKPEFAHLSAADRKNVLDILVETKPEFAAWLKAHPDSPAAAGSGAGA